MRRSTRPSLRARLVFFFCSRPRLTFVLTRCRRKHTQQWQAINVSVAIQARALAVSARTRTVHADADASIRRRDVVPAHAAAAASAPVEDDGRPGPLDWVGAILARHAVRPSEPVTYVPLLDVHMDGVGVRVATTAGEGYSVGVGVRALHIHDRVTRDTCFPVILEHAPSSSSPPAVSTSPPPEGLAEERPVVDVLWSERAASLHQPAGRRLRVEVDPVKLVYAHPLMARLRELALAGPLWFVHERARLQRDWLLDRLESADWYRRPTVLAPSVFASAVGRETVDIDIRWHGPIILVPLSSTLATAPITTLDCADVVVVTDRMPDAERLRQQADAPARLAAARRDHTFDPLLADRLRLHVDGFQAMICAVGDLDSCKPLLEAPDSNALDLVRTPSVRMTPPSWARLPDLLSFFAHTCPHAFTHQPQDLDIYLSILDPVYGLPTTGLGCAYVRADMPRRQRPRLTELHGLRTARFGVPHSVPPATVRISEAQLVILAQQLYMVLEAILPVAPDVGPMPGGDRGYAGREVDHSVRIGAVSLTGRLACCSPVVPHSPEELLQTKQRATAAQYPPPSMPTPDDGSVSPHGCSDHAQRAVEVRALPVARLCSLSPRLTGRAFGLHALASAQAHGSARRRHTVCRSLHRRRHPRHRLPRKVRAMTPLRMRHSGDSGATPLTLVSTRARARAAQRAPGLASSPRCSWAGSTSGS